jgi:uncharacterized protein YdeI (YjbR/CyaY-like superfamily)
MSRNPQVDAYFERLTVWSAELALLRNILIDSGLNETYKWRNPCYTFGPTNVALIGGFKDHCVLSFLKGVLLKDTHGLLTAPGENSQSARVIKFYDQKSITNQTDILKQYLQEAIMVEQAGLQVSFSAKDELKLPEELSDILSKDEILKSAFEGLTPGRQRGYVLYFSAAKQSKTRISRIVQYRDKIISGKGFNDCTCGLSQRMPNCDGSHKQLELGKQ